MSGWPLARQVARLEEGSRSLGLGIADSPEPWPSMLTAQSRVSRVVRGVLGPLSPPSLRRAARTTVGAVHADSQNAAAAGHPCRMHTLDAAIRSSAADKGAARVCLRGCRCIVVLRAAAPQKCQAAKPQLGWVQHQSLALSTACSACPGSCQRATHGWDCRLSVRSMTPWLESPKSVSFRWPSLATSRLSGFRSLWMMPCARLGQRCAPPSCAADEASRPQATRTPPRACPASACLCDALPAHDAADSSSLAGTGPRPARGANLRVAVLQGEHGLRHIDPRELLV